MAIGVGFGLSRGPLRIGNHDCSILFGACAGIGSSVYYEWSAAVRRNLELSIERRSDSAFQWRFYLGGARILNPSSGTCESDTAITPVARHCLSDDDEISTLYVGTSLGWAFEL